MVAVYNIGVLALQGAVEEHLRGIDLIGHRALKIKTTDQLEKLNALIIPGGESTAIGKLMVNYGFIEPIREFAAQGKPIWGTCAGMVLMAKNQAKEPSPDGAANLSPPSLNLIDLKIKRNAFGRQRESFEALLEINGLTKPFPAVFIRAPYALSAGAGVETLASIGKKIVCAKQGKLLVCSFHPELTDDDRLLKMFVDLI
jgi:5'-phosphate synthase pdxT subunit